MKQQFYKVDTSGNDSLLGKHAHTGNHRDETYIRHAQKYQR